MDWGSQHQSLIYHEMPAVLHCHPMARCQPGSPLQLWLHLAALGGTCLNREWLPLVGSSCSILRWAQWALCSSIKAVTADASQDVPQMSLDIHAAFCCWFYSQIALPVMTQILFIFKVVPFICCDTDKVQWPWLFLGMGPGELQAQRSARKDWAGCHWGNPGWWAESGGMAL